MGVEYNQLGEECELLKASQREEICMGWDNNFYTWSFCAWGESREQEIELGAVASMEGEF
jgi:hypothetical protein